MVCFEKTAARECDLLHSPRQSRPNVKHDAKAALLIEATAKRRTHFVLLRATCPLLFDPKEPQGREREAWTRLCVGVLCSLVGESVAPTIHVLVLDKLNVQRLYFYVERKGARYLF